MSTYHHGSSFNGIFRPTTFYECTVFFGYDNSACPTEIFNRNRVIQIPVKLTRDQGCSCEGSDITKIFLTSITESRSLHRGALAHAAETVDDEGCQRFSVDVLGDAEIAVRVVELTVDAPAPEGLEVGRRRGIGEGCEHALCVRVARVSRRVREGVAERLGIGYDDLKAANPRLIYASATGYGKEGEESGEPSFDHLGLARSGIMNAVGEPDMPPMGIAGGVADQMGGIMLAYGVMSALLARERHGMGQEVNASHLGSMTYLQGLSVSMKLMGGAAIPRTFRAKAYNALWNHYRCGDDQWLALAMIQPDRYWADFCRIIERPELAEDPRFASIAAMDGSSTPIISRSDAARSDADILASLASFSAATSAASKPHQCGFWIVVAAGSLFFVCRFGCIRRTAELATPQHDRIVKHATLFEVVDQGGDGLVDNMGVVGPVSYTHLTLPTNREV